MLRFQRGVRRALVVALLWAGLTVVWSKLLGAEGLPWWQVQAVMLAAHLLYAVGVAGLVGMAWVVQWLWGED